MTTTDLDRDVADWFDPDCQRPRLTLLGPVKARTHGTAMANRTLYFTELLAFLALRRADGGVNGPEIRHALGVRRPGAERDHLSTLRKWLGVNPATGECYLPLATDTPASRALGTYLYQLDDGLLVDLDLFSRLRARGTARGTTGLTDLTTALQLVTGRPFDQARPMGWRWIPAERYSVTTMAIATVALIVVTAALEQGQQDQARAAADIAALAAPDEEATRVCLARIAEGRP